MEEVEEQGIRGWGHREEEGDGKRSIKGNEG